MKFKEFILFESDFANLNWEYPSTGDYTVLLAMMDYMQENPKTDKHDIDTFFSRFFAVFNYFYHRLKDIRENPILEDFHLTDIQMNKTLKDLTELFNYIYPFHRTGVIFDMSSFIKNLNKVTELKDKEIIDEIRKFNSILVEMIKFLEAFNNPIKEIVLRVRR